MAWLVLKYLQLHWIYTIVIGCFGAAIALYMLTDIHILVPCLWKAISGYECPGCGMTTALIALLQMKWEEAWSANPMIFGLVPVFIFLILRDFRRFIHRQTGFT
ncbi:DUF2752 domain-containing protein [Sphingobacterium sp. BIGb0165]|uniref:DUF2752 domain-containing protein n=1 Tax=Sphingobacterium sp. BIGb0165 TaxID=2940615 RepID=UPI002166CC37|nr:DUF2752 domain-containing protein [Sphingobacterium sp. BIGb0165]MCS4226770.1 hypothetical protein [Sphingobacterium sp. BIGb0165]